MTTEIITIEQLAAYLSHEINFTAEDYGDKIFILKGINRYQNDDRIEILSYDETGCVHTFEPDEIKPILRPLSSLTKEITHNNETFVPIEWFEIGDDNNESLEYDYGNVKLINKLEFIAKHEIVNDIQYLPYAVVQKLLSWHIDIFGLCNKNLAVEYEH